MRLSLAALVAMAIVGIAFGLSATIPVGVSEQDVEKKAQTIADGSSTADRQASLDLAVATLRAEQTRRVRFMFAAYVALWAALGGYMLALSRRQTRLLSELERLRSQIVRE